jgi:hypothetical protein
MSLARPGLSISKITAFGAVISARLLIIQRKFRLKFVFQFEFASVS